MEKKLSCSKCGSLVSEGDSFCGNCGNKLVHEEEKKEKVKEGKVIDENTLSVKEMIDIQLQQEQSEKLEEEMREYAQNLIIECEGNKFKAIKEFKDYYNSDNETASQFISKAYDLINNNYEEDEEKEKKVKQKKIEQDKKEIIEEDTDEEDPFAEIVKRNDYSFLNSVNEIREVHGLSFLEAKSKVDEIIEKHNKKLELQKEAEKQANESTNSVLPSVAEVEKILEKNNHALLSSINEVRDLYGCGFLEAREIVDKVANRNKVVINNIPVTIKKTIIVAHGTNKKALSAAGRGFVGGALLGPVGMLAGTASAKTKDTTTFQIIYSNGTQITKTVKNNSSDFKEFCKYLDN